MMRKVAIEQAPIQLRVPQRHIVYNHISIAKNVHKNSYNFPIRKQINKDDYKIKSNKQLTSRYSTPLYVLVRISEN